MLSRYGADENFSESQYFKNSTVNIRGGDEKYYQSQEH